MPIGSVAVASANSSAPSRTGARPSGFRPTRRRGAPFSSCLRICRARETAGAGAAGAAALLDRPVQRGFDRRRGGVDVMAVEAEPGFQPQAVARAEPDRQHVADCRAAPRQRLGMSGRDGNLETVLAGIAGARDEAVDAHDLARPGIHEAHRRHASAQSFASADSAFGPCSAISARSASESMSQTSDRCARRCASSSALQAALTTRNSGRRNSPPSGRRECRHHRW